MGHGNWKSGPACSTLFFLLNRNKLRATAGKILALHFQHFCAKISLGPRQVKLWQSIFHISPPVFLGLHFPHVFPVSNEVLGIEKSNSGPACFTLFLLCYNKLRASGKWKYGPEHTTLFPCTKNKLRPWQEKFWTSIFHIFPLC